MTSEPAGIACGATLHAAGFSQGTVVTLTATAGPFSDVRRLERRRCSGDGACVVTMDTAKQVQATFDLRSPITLTVTKAGNGTGTVTSTPPGISCGSTCSAIFGGVVTLTATADAATASPAGAARLQRPGRSACWRWMRPRT